MIHIERINPSIHSSIDAPDAMIEYTSEISESGSRCDHQQYSTLIENQTYAHFIIRLHDLLDPSEWQAGTLKVDGRVGVLDIL